MPLVTARKPKSYHRKRHGLHHHHSKSYLKAYWPYIPITLIVLSGVWLNTALKSATAVLGISQDYSRAALLSETNKDRAASNDPALRFSSQLNNAAQSKAQDMVVNNYWAHVAPNGTTPWYFITASGYVFQKAGENLAYGFGSAYDVVKAWLNSPEHKANMLNKEFEDVGFGVAESNNYRGEGPKVIVVAEYGEPIIAVPTSSSSPLLPEDVKSASVSQIELLVSPVVFWIVLAATALSGAGAAVLIIRHAKSFKKLVARGELFILHHPLLDIVFIFVLTYGVVLTRTAGFIK